MLSNKILVPIVAFSLVAGTLSAVPSAYAQGAAASKHFGFFDGIVTLIAQKFGLDRTQVQSAVNEYISQNSPNITPRPTMSADEMRNREKSRLDQLVKDGKITSDKEKAILDELASLRSKYSVDSMKDKTPEERKTQMQTMQDELKSWAQSQGIDASYVMPLGGMGRGPGRFPRGWMQ